MLEVQSQVSDVTFDAIGSDSTNGGSATLVRLGLTANERAAEFRGFAVSSLGEVREVRAVGYMVPEQGWVVRSVGTDCEVVLSGNAVTVDFNVTGGPSAADWTGHLSVSFTQNYAAP